MLYHVTACLGFVTILQLVLVQPGELEDANEAAIAAKMLLMETTALMKAARSNLKEAKAANSESDVVRAARVQLKESKAQVAAAKSSFSEAKETREVTKKNNKDPLFDILYKQVFDKSLFFLGRDFIAGLF